MQESIGDSMFLAFMTPQHLNRLGLVSDANTIETPLAHFDVEYPFDDGPFDPRRPAPPAVKTSFDLSLLLRLALSKIPQIPFEYIMDVFRWDLFAGEITTDQSNAYLWRLISQHQGVGPPESRSRDDPNLFDAGAKFHVADNTPFVRLIHHHPA